MKKLHNAKLGRLAADIRKKVHVTDIVALDEFSEDLKAFQHLVGGSPATGGFFDQDSTFAVKWDGKRVMYTVDLENLVEPSTRAQTEWEPLLNAPASIRREAMQKKVLESVAEFIQDALSQKTMAELIEPGKTKIYYTQGDNFESVSSGMYRKDPVLPTVESLSKTHVLLGTTKETDLEKIWSMMQGEQWSPHGQANDYVTSLNCHTSMSMGDVVEIDGKFHVVALGGFLPLK